ncbi:hypothetical protein ASPACDRAFT_1853987 [Aspergillus aculeatus ATCC 16872]|uniref:Uncharacterized protein n=1 Tax=Aspergillus aculeatus (strain ATCC 16872 / CBS 172.66 / WB 5094) TaxID=690307 RepID=A0A1L9X0E9_ASPA1|nr:uncharacterized protein ASPACDRAFT_1853987 [Aspergillus aculeatus ATCC 16872]OJK01960.1 hypothetical protein ASPACDRAFT_1853987 [Aspergillus aculeatus ATCC 16872]
MKFALFLSSALVAIVPALAYSSTQAGLFAQDHFTGPYVHSNGDGSCITTPAGVINSVELIPGMTCQLYREPSCAQEAIPLKRDSASLRYDIGAPARSARCLK